MSPPPSAPAPLALAKAREIVGKCREKWPGGSTCLDDRSRGWCWPCGQTRDIAVALVAFAAERVLAAEKHERYMERCRIMLVIEEAFGCRHPADEPCSCAACVVRRAVMADDALAPSPATKEA